MTYLTKLTDQLYHLQLNDQGNGQIIHAYLTASPTKTPLIEKALQATPVTREALSACAEVIAWDYGRFPSEHTRTLIRQRYHIEI